MNLKGRQRISKLGHIIRLFEFQPLIGKFSHPLCPEWSTQFQNGVSGMVADPDPVGFLVFAWIQIPIRFQISLDLDPDPVFKIGFPVS